MDVPQSSLLLLPLLQLLRLPLLPKLSPPPKSKFVIKALTDVFIYENIYKIFYENKNKIKIKQIV